MDKTPNTKTKDRDWADPRGMPRPQTGGGDRKPPAKPPVKTGGAGAGAGDGKDPRKYKDTGSKRPSPNVPDKDPKRGYGERNPQEVDRNRKRVGISTTPDKGPKRVEDEKRKPTRIHGRTLGPIKEDGTRDQRKPVGDLDRKKDATDKGRASGVKEPMSNVGPLKKKPPYDWAKDGL